VLTSVYLDASLCIVVGNYDVIIKATYMLNNLCTTTSMCVCRIADPI
jgi:hypothetical protein